MHHHRHFVYNVYWATLRLTLQSVIAEHVSIMATRPRNNMNQTQELLEYFCGADSVSRRFVFILFCLHPLTLVGWVSTLHIGIAFSTKEEQNFKRLGQTPFFSDNVLRKTYSQWDHPTGFCSAARSRKDPLQCRNGLGLSKQLQICVFNGSAKNWGGLNATAQL